MIKGLIIVICFFALKAEGQLALINDPDGYTYVRESKSSNSKALGKLYTDDIFLYYFDKQDDEWANVFYSNADKSYLQGYIHKSRLLPLNELKEMSRSEENRIEKPFELLIQNDSLKVALETARFNLRNHRIERSKDGTVVKIDGKEPYGIDGDLPRIEIRKVSVWINNRKINFPSNAYRDLYEPGIESFNVHFDKKGNIFFYMPENSDGAGGYYAAWMIKKGKYVKRYVDKP